MDTATRLILPQEMQLIPTRNGRVLLPGVVVRLQIGRKDTTALLDSLWLRFSKQESIVVGCVPLLPTATSATSDVSTGSSDSLKLPAYTVGYTAPQKSSRSLDVEPSDGSSRMILQSDLFTWGCAARIVEFSKASSRERRLHNTNYLLTLEGVARFKIKDVIQSSPYLVASVQIYLDPEVNKDDMELQALIMSLRNTGNDLSEALSQLQLPPTALAQLKEMLRSTQPGQLADLFASMIDISLDEKLQILETVDLKARLNKVVSFLHRQLQVLRISQKLHSTVQNKLGQKQREFLLREQMEAIKKELGEGDDTTAMDEIVDLEKRIAEAKLPEEPLRSANRELKRLKRMNPNMSEYQVIRTYLEWMSELPWSNSTIDNLDVTHARGILDHDHYGLDRVKSRIIEFLATSLGKSIANALGRKFHRISLGGVHDEAEIRGHRRTYLASLPGLIIQGLRRCGVNNPVMLLDEIDKLGHDFRGDPSSALLEVLDPEQNSTFLDHYLGVSFDLSNVLFISTANDMDGIPAPLLDRMEVVTIPGYTYDEKLSIAKRYLLPKQISAHGLTIDSVTVSDKQLLLIATGYTREAGVRNLEREIGAVCRSLAVEYSVLKDNGRDKLFNGDLTNDRLESILGTIRFDNEVSERSGIPGVVTGLAWTSSGSGGLLFIESSCIPGTGKLHLTGKLGDVIKESAQIGITWVRANATKLDIQSQNRHLFEEADIHIHFPSGSIPKDGPSAGVAIITSLVSLLTGSPVRDHTAMTGEITLRGQVLPVGGIKEKVLAAHRGGVNRVILPLRNRKDITADIPDNVKTDMEFVYAKTVWDVLRAAFPLNLRFMQIGSDLAQQTINARL
ncbi:hypothetical protein BASA60_011391 [Batrachochytrium salamandrivorans]|nr:hypothetical protein BASA60_011391 [Batrachochytrium salamandrivorans]